MPTKTDLNVFEELDALRANVAVCERRERELQVAASRSRRELDAARGALRNLYAASEAEKRDPKPAEERKLRDAVRELEERFEMREVPAPGDRSGGGTRHVEVDVAIEARRRAAFEVTEEARAAIDAHVAANRERLQEVLVLQSLDARTALEAATEQFFASLQGWKRIRDRWLEYGERWEIAPAELPLMPFPGIALQDIERVVAQARGGAKDPRGLLPMPARLAPGGDPDVVEHVPLRGWQHVPRVISSEGGILGA